MTTAPKSPRSGSPCIPLMDNRSAAYWDNRIRNLPQCTNEASRAIGKRVRLAIVPDHRQGCRVNVFPIASRLGWILANVEL